MSFRSLRNLNEILKLLDYPKVISIESFRKPNFVLVAEILTWLIKRFDSDIEIFMDIGTSVQRLEFIKKIFFLIDEKTNLKLDIKKLYQADGYAVQEILKLVNLFYKSINRLNKTKLENSTYYSTDAQLNQTKIQKKLNELKNVRKLVSDIITEGANLFDMLNKEIEIRNKRNYVLFSAFQLNEIEKKLENTINLTKKNIESINYKIDNVALDELNLDKKIEKKVEELERCLQRLEHLKLTIPPFQDEYDKLENELILVYSKYIVKYQCLIYLENQIEKLEKDALNEQDKKIFQITESNLNKDEQEYDDEDDLKEETFFSNDYNQNNCLSLSKNDQNQTKNEFQVTKNNENKNENDDEESLDESFNFDNNTYENDNSELDSEDEIELMNLSNNNAKVEKEITKIVNKVDDNSDNDF